LRATALDELETAVLKACAAEEEWPAQVAAGVFAGVDFAIARPELARMLVLGPAFGGQSSNDYERLVGRLVGFLRIKAPVDARLPASTDEAMVAGLVGLVGDHVRLGRVDRLRRLRPELVLMTLLPYLGFAEAQRCADMTADT
jgi:hypothetical protein